MTAQKGIDDINEVCDNLVSSFPSIKNPIISSTGVIGVPLPKDKIISKLKEFNLDNKNGENLSKAIMTTDSYPKRTIYEVELEDGSSFKIGAIAKGAGMINPNRC